MKSVRQYNAFAGNMPPHAFSLYALTPGKKIAGRYEVVRPNRQGGFSTAFEVTDAKNGSRCELQLFPSGLFENETQAEQFRDRLRPWKDVDSEAVLGVRDVLDADDETLALITDFPDGESLRDRLNREERLERIEVVAMGLRLLEGLEQVHAESLVHGDIKPYTVHARGSGPEVRPLLVDGGVTPGLWTAKAVGDKTQLIGTPYYAPIEQFGGDAPDVRSDIYNVATVLYECLTGVVPWEGRSFLEVFQAKLQDPMPMARRAPSAKVDGPLEEVIRMGCLADRNRRYATAAEFRQALEEVA